MTAIGLLVLSALLPAMMTVSAVTPPSLGGDYYSVNGVLDTDTYTLYPWDDSSINIGFSKYGELISADDSVGLEYKGIDAFASSVVPQNQWNNGWLMDIHWVDNGCLQNIWAYALFSDWVTAGGSWRQNQMSYDASAAGDIHGGRRTNGFAVSDPIQVVYDGPRKAIYLLQTHIYDKAPGEAGGCELVELTIQLVFDKVQKDLMEIKDIKRICGPDKVVGPLQIEFSQRGEWDLGSSTLNNEKTYAEFYDNLETVYDEHPFFSTEEDVTYDLCQMLNTQTSLVGYAAFWPQLTSKWVTGTKTLPIVSVFGTADKLTSLETFSHDVTVPMEWSYPPDEYPWVKFFTYENETTARTTIFLPYAPETYPTGAGEMTEIPWVFVWDTANACWQELNLGPDWKWINVPTEDLPLGIDVNQAVQLQYPIPSTFGKQYLVLYKMEAKGAITHTNIAPLECTSPSLFEDETYIPSYGMYTEPAAPFVIGEWDFELDFDHVENSTHQFRCVSVYGLTDLNNAVDPDQHIKVGETTVDGFRIDSEVQYQLAKTFNPIDLNDAAEKDTFRWCQKGDLTTTITLTAQNHDKYGNEYPECPLQSLWIPSKWGAYCNDSEKVLLLDSAGAAEPLLLTRGTQYTIGGAPWTITLNPSKIPGYSAYDYYKILYTTKVVSTQSSLHDGRYEWLVVGETSHASDSIGSAMLGVGYADWKDVEVWISALDVESESYGPSIPQVLRRFATMQHNRLDYQYASDEGDARYAFRDDWSTPEDWDMQTTINPYAISSSNIIVVGGPINNAAASYWNDFTDALVFTNYGSGYYAPGCWARTSQPSLSTLSLRGTDMDTLAIDDLWYNSATTEDTYGYSIVSVYKDLNETVGLVVYGYTAEDTYYTCYALRGGLLAWFQNLDEGVTTVVLEINYSSLHPVTFHVRECLGPFTETTGFDTSFKTTEYSQNFTIAATAVTDEAKSREICYKLVDIDWCGQVHPDP
ncbi:MAG: hypothetical protein NTV61_04335 [Candidatus Bathyarchaeota archaeon]|nr:hypothetical protein [Candidatus Bathyarchaeota archaeon]